MKLNAVWILNCFGRHDPPHGETETVGQNSGLRSFTVRATPHTCLP